MNEFLRVEDIFAGALLDDVVRDLSKTNADNLEVVIDENLAHQQINMRSKLVLAMLRQVETFTDRYGSLELPDSLLAVLNRLAELKGSVYGEIVLAADTIIRNLQVPPFDSRVSELREKLLDEEIITGEEAYRLYMKATWPELQKAGGRVIYYGKSNQFLIGPDAESWDAILLVEHASVAKFMEFAQNEDYLRTAGHRTAALEDSRLLPSNEIK